MRKFKRLTLTLVALLAVTTGAWADETPLLTIESKDYTTFKSGSKTFDDKVTVTFSNEVSNYGNNNGWYNPDGASLLTVAGTNGYTITSCKFYTENGTASTGYTVVGESPSVNLDDGFVFNDNSESVGYTGITKIEVYGAAKPEITEWSLTPDETNKWTFQMPASNVELQVEYYAESNLFLSKDALADKANIAVKNGETTVAFGEDGKSDNTVTEGNTVTATYTGTKKVIGFKAVKAAPAGKTVDLSTYSGNSYEVTEDVTFTGTTDNEISILYKGEGYEVTLDNVNAPKCIISAWDNYYTVNVKLKGTSRLAGIYNQNTDIIIGEAAAGGTVILSSESTPLGGNATTVTINGGTVKVKTSVSTAVDNDLVVNGGAVYIEANEDNKAVSGNASGSVNLYGWNGSAWETYSEHRYLSTDNSKAPSEWTW